MLIEWMFELEKYEGTLIAFKKLVEKFPFSKEEKEKRRRKRYFLK